MRPVTNWIPNKRSVRTTKRIAIPSRRFRNIYGTPTNRYDSAMNREIASVGSPVLVPPPTNEKIGMIEVIPSPSKTLLTTASADIRMTWGVYAPNAFLYRR